LSALDFGRREPQNAMTSKRRDFLKSSLAIGVLATLNSGCASPPRKAMQSTNSPYGYWRTRRQLPEFIASGIADGSRRVHMMGNRALQLQAGSDGTVGVYEESEGQRWLFYGDEVSGTGESIVQLHKQSWGSARGLWPTSDKTQLTYASTWFDVQCAAQGLSLTRRVLCPEGDVPWLFIEITLELATNSPALTFVHTEHWQLKPRLLQLFEPKAQRDKRAASINHTLHFTQNRASATEDFSAVENAVGRPRKLTLESLGNAQTRTTVLTGENPGLQAVSTVRLKPGKTTKLYFRLGILPETADSHAATADFFEDNLKELQKRIPRANISFKPESNHEISWHAACLSGGANRDAVLGGHSLNQGSAYAFLAGGNAAARDQLQHAIPLIYTEPKLALSILRNTCSWCSADGDLPYALAGNKLPFTQMFRPSDQNLWALWLAAEYGIATGDLAAFNVDVPFHPVYQAAPASLKENLIRQFRFLKNQIGLGARGHIRILNADWNDLALEVSGGDKAAMQAEGGSVLNSAMAAWVLPVFAVLLEKLGEHTEAKQARLLAETLRLKVVAAWNGRWFDRAYAPDGGVVGRDACWLEVQPWAILCGACDKAQAAQILDTIDNMHRKNSPLGARVVWPLPDSPHAGMGIHGGIWYSVNMTLVWAASTVSALYAQDEWGRMTLASHSKHVPESWAGTLSGPDAWNSPETKRPGETWAYPWLSMQDYPIGNMHSHSQPLLAYLRLLGICPLADGTLQCGRGSFESAIIKLNEDGHGYWRGAGNITLTTKHGQTSGTYAVNF
jgi:hypothetical protein